MISESRSPFPAVVMSTLLQQPDIEYHPDEAKYLARVARNLAENPDRTSIALPSGFSKQVEGPIVWEGKDWTSEAQWVYNLSVDELGEIEDAVAYFNSAPCHLICYQHRAHHLSRPE